jgi:hypothetical protein
MVTMRQEGSHNSLAFPSHKRANRYSCGSKTLDAMVPVYQKHLTKGDVDALAAFYSTATGQKLIKEMPQITAEAMQEMLPLMRKNMDAMTQRMQEEIAAMVRESESKGGKTGAQINNSGDIGLFSSTCSFCRLDCLKNESLEAGRQLGYDLYAIIAKNFPMIDLDDSHFAIFLP